MSDNKFNILAALNSELKKEVHEPRMSTASGGDRGLFWPFLFLSDLPEKEEFKIRFLPPDEIKNPQGYVTKKMWQIAYELDRVAKPYARNKCERVLGVKCVDPNAVDPIEQVLSDFYNVLKEPSPRGDDLRAWMNNPAPNPERADLNLFIKQLTQTKIQYIFPVLLYATCDTRKEGNYDRYSNYQPDEDNYLPRLFCLDDRPAVREMLLENLQPKTLDSKKTYIRWNDAEEGMDVIFSYSGPAGQKKLMTFAKESKHSSPLDEEFHDKLVANSDNYPDLVASQLEKHRKSDADMLTILRNSPYAKPLIDFGFINPAQGAELSEEELPF